MPFLTATKPPTGVGGSFAAELDDELEVELAALEAALESISGTPAELYLLCLDAIVAPQDKPCKVLGPFKKKSLGQSKS